jgi:hypothetical protein
MAYYENLPIYKKSMELAVYMENVVRNFPRYHKYSIGTDMRDLSKNLVTLIIKANSRKDKRRLLAELRDKSEEMKVNIMIGKEVKAFKSFQQFQHAASLAVEISRQSEGWLRSQEGEGPELRRA